MTDLLRRRDEFKDVPRTSVIMISEKRTKISCVYCLNHKNGRIFIIETSNWDWLMNHNVYRWESRHCALEILIWVYIASYIQLFVQGYFLSSYMYIYDLTFCCSCFHCLGIFPVFCWRLRSGESVLKLFHCTSSINSS